MNRTMIAGVVAVLVLAACGEKKADQPQAMPDMGNMPGMAMRSDSLMPMMRAHLDSLGALAPQFAAGMLSMHDAIASRMLDAMGADMTGMGMKGDSAWTALTDSVRRDLAEVPSLSGRALETRIKTYIDRMRRLLRMHETMMRTMMKPE